MPTRRSRAPRWPRASGEEPEWRPQSFPEPRWLELDRVRSILSCIILAVLLGLIVIGGRRVTWTRPPETIGMRHGVLIETGLIAPSPGRR